MWQEINRGGIDMEQSSKMTFTKGEYAVMGSAFDMIRQPTRYKREDRADMLKALIDIMTKYMPEEE